MRQSGGGLVGCDGSWRRMRSALATGLGVAACKTRWVQRLRDVRRAWRMRDRRWVEVGPGCGQPGRRIGLISGAKWARPISGRGRGGGFASRVGIPRANRAAFRRVFRGGGRGGGRSPGRGWRPGRSGRPGRRRAGDPVAQGSWLGGMGRLASPWDGRKTGFRAGAVAPGQKRTRLTHNRRALAGDDGVDRSCEVRSWRRRDPLPAEI